jgi:hypothetical protein
MADDAPTFVRDLEEEDRLQQIIYNTAAGPNSDGEYSDGEDSSDGEDAEEFSAKCLNDSGEGLELEKFRDDDDDEEEPSGSKSSGSLAKKKVYIKSC